MTRSDDAARITANRLSPIRRLNLWVEQHARQRAASLHKKLVETSVAREILLVARTCAETCKMGVVFGPAQIGKMFTLESIEGDQTFGCPMLIRVDESVLRPFPLCRAVKLQFAAKNISRKCSNRRANARPRSWICRRPTTSAFGISLGTSLGPLGLWPPTAGAAVAIVLTWPQLADHLRQTIQAVLRLLLALDKAR